MSAKKKEPEKLVYTVSELAQVLSISMPTAYQMVKRQGFPVVAIGKKLVVPKIPFHKWLESQTQNQ